MSMEDDKYDKLDKLFQSRLGDEGQEAEEWNTPPAYLLDGALDIVNEDYHKKRRAFWIWISIGLLLLGFTGGMVYSHFTIQDLNQKISLLEDQQIEWQKERITNVEDKLINLSNVILQVKFSKKVAQCCVVVKYHHICYII